MKQNRTFYFSVEGETEDWYLGWLQNCINGTEQAAYKVKIERLIEPDPCKFVKRVTNVSKISVTHVFDREGTDEKHTKRFMAALENMKKAERMGKQIKYANGYSNYTFDLWMILHKKDCNGCKSNRTQYLKDINAAYQERFESMDEYKREKDFKRVLSKLTLDDVKAAIERSKKIMEKNMDAGYVLREHCGYKYYEENPSSILWKAIEEILQTCDLMG